MSFVSGVPLLTAEKAGLVAGDVITYLGGGAVYSPTAPVNVLLRTSPGRTLRLRWSDQ